AEPQLEACAKATAAAGLTLPSDGSGRPCAGRPPVSPATRERALLAGAGNRAGGYRAAAGAAGSADGGPPLADRVAPGGATDRDVRGNAEPARARAPPTAQGGHRPDRVRVGRQRLLARCADPLPAAPQRERGKRADRVGRADLAHELPHLRPVVLGGR